nr:MAG: hypothetical protein DIU68_01890 [Chloroflexota bacterium]
MLAQLRLQSARWYLVLPLALVVLVAGIIVFATVWATVRPAASPSGVMGMAITMASEPYPLTVGNTTLLVSLLDAAGQPVSGAEVSAVARMRREGTLPLAATATSETNGVYRLPLTWPMTGRWDVDITAALPGGETAGERFTLYVYPVPPVNLNARTTFVSASELAARPHDPLQEYRIIIPQGTHAEMISGHGEDLIPEEVHLSLSGQHVLVIQNDDIAHHTVGPFFIRAGETIRQEFRRPALYQGGCSIRHGAEVSIIVDA